MAASAVARQTKYRYRRRRADARSNGSRIANRRATQKCTPQTGSATTVMAVNTASWLRLDSADGALKAKSKTVAPRNTRPTASSTIAAALNRDREQRLKITGETVLPCA